MSHSHDHGSSSGPRLLWSMGLTSLFVAGEAIAGWHAHSLALLSDAGHNLADALALGLSWYALRLGRRRPDHRRTFGYHRAGILAALANAVSLVVIALVIFWEAYRRLAEPHEVAGGMMIGVALIAVLLNGMISWSLHHGAKSDHNLRGAYLHMVGDAISAVGVAIAGVLILSSGKLWIDPLVSCVIGALIIWSSWGLLKDTVSILLESVPSDFAVERVAQAITAVPGVQAVHDLHVWTIGSSHIAASCHILVTEQAASEAQRIQRAVTAALGALRISHSTIQVEVASCVAPGHECSLVPEPAHHEHGHGSDGQDRDHDHQHDHAHGHAAH